MSSYDQLATRQYQLLGSKDKLKKAAPNYDQRFESKVATTRMEAQFELATSALIGGLTNVSTITCAATEINAQPYLGIGVNYSNHQFLDTWAETDVTQRRPLLRKMQGFVFGLIAKMAQRLEATPEGDGNMLDNTLIIYMSDAPDTTTPLLSNGLWRWSVISRASSILAESTSASQATESPDTTQWEPFTTRSSNVQATSKKLSGGLIQTLDVEGMQAGAIQQILAA